MRTATVGELGVRGQRRPPGPAPRRRRIALMAVLIAAAMPVRIATSFPVVSSVSILDLLLVLAAATLVLDLASGPLDTGYRDLFWILLIPLTVATASLAWSQDPAATLRAVLVYVEGVV